MRISSREKWTLFVKELSNLVFFWFFGIVYFFMFRLTFWGIFSDQLSDKAKFSDFVKVAYAGFRFDCMAISYFIMLPLVLLLFVPYSYRWVGYVRRVIQKIFLILMTLICAGTLNYFAEYNDQFNNFLFMGMFDEDKTAILMTILKDYNPFLNLFACAVVIAAGWLILKRYENKTFISKWIDILTNRWLWTKIALILITIVCFIFSMRGAVTSIMTRRSAAVSADSFLNKTVINPLRMISYAYKDYKALNSVGKNNPFGNLYANDVTEVILDAELERKTPVGMNLDHKQVFVILMESYDSWPLMDKYRGLGLSPQLSKIADEGIHFTNFLPAYNATFYALGCITSGIPGAGVDISKIATTIDRYRTSMFEQMEGLGYTSHFFYGGFPSWHNVGDYCAHMGADSCYYAADVPDNIGYNEWGVNDEDLFNMVIDKLDPAEKSLNVILTTSYHSPFDVDVKSKGFIYDSVDEIPEEYRAYYDGSMTLNQMGHLWYGDLAIGKFVEQAQEKFPDAVFIFTGDHYGRRFINANPTAYESSSVPLIIYGRGIEPARLDTPGSHMDILATLIDMEAPKDTPYYGFGKSMFDTSKTYGTAFGKVITRESLYVMDYINGIVKTNLKTEAVETFNEFPESFNYMQLLRMAWQFSVKGNFKAPEAKKK